MKVLKYIAFGVVYVVMLIKEVGYMAFVNAYKATQKIIELK